jgi:hypothetical protein
VWCIREVGDTTYRQNPPARLQLVQHHAGALRVDRVDGLAGREAAAKVDHALGEADLSQALIAVVVVGAVSRAAVPGGAVAAALGARLGGGRGVVDDLVIDCLVGGAQAGVVDGQEAQLGGDDAGCWGAGHDSQFPWVDVPECLMCSPSMSTDEFACTDS